MTKPLTTSQRKIAQKQFEKYTNYLFDVCMWLLENRAALKERIRLDSIGEGNGNVFDYPSYGGMPKSLSNKLGSEMVDRIQGGLEEIIKAKSMSEILPYIVIE